jgi:hypothetical protein
MEEARRFAGFHDVESGQISALSVQQGKRKSLTQRRQDRGTEEEDIFLPALRAFVLKP